MVLLYKYNFPILQVTFPMFQMNIGHWRRHSKAGGQEVLLGGGQDHIHLHVRAKVITLHFYFTTGL